ncbi:STAS domain-containing protein [Nitrospira lenta]|uniref:Anti-sigma factor antagonist n=1 Tax=Nitrospira lenta TaxID=1436998 RepID=A0A330L5J9_9BACT|nr:STAS domain-containing protein [Nitrospira lenta]SPP65119.1 putative Anti-sigma factor antagonist [Nitrospira lenta]
MQITHRTYRNADVISISGQFNFGTRKEFTAAMEKVKQSGSAHVILNFQQVTFVDSAAIGLLALSSQHYKGTSRKLSLVGIQGTVKQVLQLAHIDQMIPTYASEDLAIGAKAA